MTDHDRFQEIERLYHLALEQEPSQRAAYLKKACGDDEGLLKEAESLLAHEGQADEFMEEPALEMAAAQALAQSETPSLVGHRLGPYDVLGLLGAGGMGEVYRARDTRLYRTVAIKVLPPSLAGDPEQRKRFEREAQAVSSLNHPHICTLHDVGSQDEVDFLVMEYLQGETLAQRLKKGALPLDQALRYAIEIAGALDAAHRKGVIHRDLKPGNIMLTKSGAKVLDFGLAKVRGAAAAAGMTQPPSTLTEQGVILGTLQYMAPEQLEGKEADARTDIFAFGVVVYEMATGKKAFEGDSRASVMAAIMSADPRPISKLQAKSPPALDRVVKTCLTKDPDERWQTAQDLKRELQWIDEAGSQEDGAIPVVLQRNKRERFAWAFAAVALLLAAALALVHFRETRAEMTPVRFSVYPPEKGTLGHSSAISPDGRSLAFVVNSADGRRYLCLRRLDSLEARPLAVVLGDGPDPFWSPDSRLLGFFDTGKLRKIGASGGSVQTFLADIQADAGGTWNRDGVILFAPFQSPLFRVLADGGAAMPVTTLDQSRGELGHYWPQFLPDGRHFLYLVSCNAEHRTNEGIYVGSLGSKERKLLLGSHWRAVYAPAPGVRDGYLLFLRDGTLMAQRFDPDRLELSEGAVSVVEKMGGERSRWGTFFSVSANGILAHENDSATLQQLSWYDRSGKPLGTVNQPGQDEDQPALSPDGKRLAFRRPNPLKGNKTDIWVLDLIRGAASRLTLDPADNSFPVWSPDGSRIVFSSDREGTRQLYQKNSSGAGSDELLVKSDEDKWPNDWSSDGRFISFGSFNLKTVLDAWIQPLDGDRKAFPIVQTPFGDCWVMFSPDRRWVAYNSDESGRFEVYVRPFNAASGVPSPVSKGNALSRERWQVSTSGGFHQRWRRDGKELFYVTGEGKMMAVEIKSGRAFNAGIPKPLFEAHISTEVAAYPSYDVSADGQRFLINTLVGEEKQPITVVVNWQAELKR